MKNKLALVCTTLLVSTLAHGAEHRVKDNKTSWRMTQQKSSRNLARLTQTTTILMIKTSHSRAHLRLTKRAKLTCVSMMMRASGVLVDRGCFRSVS